MSVLFKVIPPSRGQRNNVYLRIIVYVKYKILGQMKSHRVEYLIQILQENDIENHKRDEQSITEYTYI